MPPVVLLFGLGYTATRLAEKLLANGATVMATTRNAARMAEMEKMGVQPLLFPLQQPKAVLANVTHVLSSVPPAETGAPVLAAHLRDLKAAPQLTWAGYLSATSVYGDYGGAWVTETSETRPTGPRGQHRLKAERDWLESGLPVHIFRLAGIYGPGRNVLDEVKAGAASRVDKPGHAFSRIHVDDIVQVLLASMNKPNAGAIYNVADDLPAPSADVVAYAAELLGLTPPPLQPYTPAHLSPMANSFYADNKRVRNDRIKTELGVQLQYPSYKEGLKALL